ncbi:TIGR00730 family Rossman fold protein [Candidatus Entotheonella serta]|nr:TIGR00730 family Rossman fold protein [Candidatus Entotheonella serta]
MHYICVYCGSQAGTDMRYRQTAARMGQLLAEQGYGLVYGGGHVGLIGTVAEAALEAGGSVIGVIPEAMVERELAYKKVTQLEIVPTMHERKARMASLADAFIAMPGGYGTLEELFEIITWAQLDIHAKPTGILNVAGYFDALAAMIKRAVEEGFVRAEHRHFWVLRTEPAALLNALREHQMPPVRPWEKRGASGEISD